MSSEQPSNRDHVQALFVRYSPRIRGFILTIMPSISQAEDVMQETFVTISDKADSFVRETNFVSWACSIAKFKVLEEYKRLGKTTLHLAPEVVESLDGLSVENVGDWV